MGDNRIIGFFDSGIGGMSVLKAARTFLPNESFIYVADSLYAPYGELPVEKIQERSLAIADFLVQQNVKAIVTACNTATSHAAVLLRAKYDIPIIGMEPGMKPAIAASKTHRIGVLATPATLQSDKYLSLEKSLSQQNNVVKIIAQPCPGLVDEIENHNRDKERLNSMLRKFINPLLEANVDQIVIGCTHYSLIKDEIRNLVGDRVDLVETSQAVVKHLKDSIVLSDTKIQKIKYYSSDTNAHVIFKSLFNINDPIETLVL